MRKGSGVGESVDVSYLGAVERGDMETAQKTVDEAAEKAFDDDGNVIPLSERFNPENEDIRFSVAEEEDEDGGNELPAPAGEEEWIATSPAAPRNDGIGSAAGRWGRRLLRQQKADSLCENISIRNAETEEPRGKVPISAETGTDCL